MKRTSQSGFWDGWGWGNLRPIIAGVQTTELGKGTLKIFLSQRILHTQKWSRQGVEWRGRGR